MKSVVKVLRTAALVLAMMVGTALLAMWFMAMRNRRRPETGESPDPPVAARGVMAPAATASTSEAVRSPDGDLEWSREEIRSLKAHVSNATIHALLEILRERDGEPVNYHELMQRTGRTMPQVRADLASFSRAVKRIEDQRKWPIDIAAPTDGSSRIAYTSPKAYLDWWFEG